MARKRRIQTQALPHENMGGQKGGKPAVTPSKMSCPKEKKKNSVLKPRKQKVCVEGLAVARRPHWKKNK